MNKHCIENNSTGKYTKRQKHQTSVKNVMFMLVKTVLTDIIYVVNRKGNRLYDIFEIKVAFSSCYFSFRVLF